MTENHEEKFVCQKILEKLGFTGFQIGNTKVFLRAGQMAELDARRAEVQGNAIKIIQRRTRTHIARKQYVALRVATIHAQSLWREKVACKLYAHMRQEGAAIKIQKNLRRHLARKVYTKLMSCALVLQTGLRAMAAHDEFRYRKETKAAIIIQARWRCHRDFSCYKKLKRASIISQCGWRGRIARKELRQLSIAAKETGALQEAKAKLEKQVEELTRSLQLERRLRAELEEANEQEITKLQQSLRAMRNEVDETNALLVKECEAAERSFEEAPPIIKETLSLVEDTDKINNLSAEVEKLKALLQSEKQRADDFERKLEEAEESSEARRKRLEETERRVQQLQESLNSVSQDDIQHVRTGLSAENDLAYVVKLEFNIRVYC